MSDGECICDARNRPWLRAINYDWNVVVLFQPRCKSWTCPACAEINKAIWTMRAEHGARSFLRQGYEISFLTLTSHEKLTPAQTMNVWADAWKKLRQRAVRAAGEGFGYMMMPEQHKNGRLHMHALETARLSSRWWKDAARECGLGYMADERPIEAIGGAVQYVTKYVTKSIEDTKWPLRWRRVRVSNNWPKLPPAPEPEGWYFSPVEGNRASQQEAERLTNQGYTVYIANHAAAWVVLETDEGVL